MVESFSLSKVKCSIFNRFLQIYKNKASLKKFRVVFLQFSEDGGDDGFAEKFGLVVNFISGTKVPDGLMFRIVKYYRFPVFAPGGAGSGFFFSRIFHKELILRRKVTKKNGTMQHAASVPR
jgi:hypothetical protein